MKKVGIEPATKEAQLKRAATRTRVAASTTLEGSFPAWPEAKFPERPSRGDGACALLRRPRPKGSGAWPAPRLRRRRARVPSAVPRHRPEAEAAAAEHLPASRAKEAPDRRPDRSRAKMAEGSGGGAPPGVPTPPPPTLKGLREQMGETPDPPPHFHPLRLSLPSLRGPFLIEGGRPLPPSYPLSPPPGPVWVPLPRP